MREAFVFRQRAVERVDAGAVDDFEHFTVDARMAACKGDRSSRELRDRRIASGEHTEDHALADIRVANEQHAAWTRAQTDDRGNSGRRGSRGTGHDTS